MRTWLSRFTKKLEIKQTELLHRFFNLTISLLNFVVQKDSDVKINFSSHSFITPFLNTAKKGSNWTVAIQGPLLSKTQIIKLCNTLEVWKTAYPDMQIILSTGSQFKNIADKFLPPHVRIETYSDSYSYNNLQRQIISSYAGLKVGLQKPTKFAMKIRSDQILTNPFTFEIMEQFIEFHKFDTRNNVRYRIFTTSMNSWLSRPLGISDMLTIGLFQDVLDFWSWDQTTEEETKSSNSRLLLTRCEGWPKYLPLFPENYLAAKYLYNKGFIFSDEPYTDYMTALQEYFGILDANLLGHVWFKRRLNFNSNIPTKLFSKLPKIDLVEVDYSVWFAVTKNIIKPINEITKIESN